MKTSSAMIAQNNNERPISSEKNSVSICLKSRHCVRKEKIKIRPFCHWNEMMSHPVELVSRKLCGLRKPSLSRTVKVRKR